MSTYVLLFSLWFFPALVSAQNFFKYGSPPASDNSSMLLIISGDRSNVSLPLFHSLLEDRGYKVVVDGERRRAYNGLVTTVSLQDTSYTRTGQDLVVRRIHDQMPTDYVIEIKGQYLNLGIRRLSIRIVERKTGLLIYSLSTDHTQLLRFRDIPETVGKYF